MGESVMRVNLAIKKDNVGAFGFVLAADTPDCVVGATMLFRNGRFVVAQKDVGKDGRVHITLRRDPRNRKQRRSA